MGVKVEISRDEASIFMPEPDLTYPTILLSLTAVTISVVEPLT